mgnify:CR=1 FL=1
MKDNIEKLSGGEISVELFGEGAIVKSFEIFDAVSEDLINGGMCWTHWASGKHPAGTLFSAPCAGLGYGLDQLSSFPGCGRRRPQAAERILSGRLQDEPGGVPRAAHGTGKFRLVPQAL